MDKDKAARQARALLKNTLLPEILAEHRQEITEAWTSEKEPQVREQLWHQYTATTDLGDYLYARIDELSSGDSAD